VNPRKADLNPPLGRPGGPCHVVRRIEDEVRSPAVKEQLVTKVEQGDDLSNPEVGRVYTLELQKTRGFINKLYIGPHAQYRMDLRSVTSKDLKEAIEELGKIYHAARKSGDARKLRRFEDFQNGEKLEHVTPAGLKIVIAPERDGAKLVTTFWKGQPKPAAPVHCDTRARDPVADRVAARYSH
jgi:hypothetical protein